MSNKHYFSAKERSKLAKEGEALPDGSFPIRNTQDLRDAIKSWGLAKNKTRAKAWIIKRAKELGESSMLPDDWTSIQKAKKDISKLNKKVITNKKGHKQSVWVKTGEKTSDSKETKKDSSSEEQAKQKFIDTLKDTLKNSAYLKINKEERQGYENLIKRLESKESKGKKVASMKQAKPGKDLGRAINWKDGTVTYQDKETGKVVTERGKAVEKDEKGKAEGKVVGSKENGNWWHEMADGTMMAKPMDRDDNINNPPKFDVNDDEWYVVDEENRGNYPKEGKADDKSDNIIRKLTDDESERLEHAFHNDSKAFRKELDNAGIEHDYDSMSGGLAITKLPGLKLTDDESLYATPFWEGHAGIPMEFNHIDSSDIHHADIHLTRKEVDSIKSGTDLGKVFASKVKDMVSEVKKMMQKDESNK